MGVYGCSCFSEWVLGGVIWYVLVDVVLFVLLWY